MKNRIDSFLGRLIGLTLRFPKTVLFLGLLVTLAAIHFSQKIQVRSNFSDLLPDDHPAVVQARELEKTVGGASFIVAAVENKNFEAASRFLDDLKARLASLPEVRYVDDRPPSQFFKKNGLLYLSPEELDRLKIKIQRKLDQEKLQRAGLFVNLEEPEAGKSGDEWQDLKEKYALYLPAHKDRQRYQNRDGSLVVSLIKPDWRTTEVSKTADFLNRLNHIISELDPASPASYDPSLNVRLSGPYVKTLTQKKILIRDATAVSAVSFAGSILYLIVHFRKKRAVALIGLPLMASSVWALSLAYFFFGSLNLFSSVACAILLGLATDYGIHIYTDYVRLRLKPMTAVQALKQAMQELGVGFVAAAFTTASAFFSLMFSRFKALFEFGALAGCGILLCFLAYLILFPPLAALLEKRSPLTKKELKEELEYAEPKAKPIFKWVFSRGNLVISSLILLLPLIAVGAGRLRFDYNLNHILGHQETKSLDDRVDQIFNHSVNPEVALARNREDAQRVAQAIRAVQEKNEKTPEGTTIRQAISLLDFVPDRQEERIQKIRSLQTLFTPTVIRSLKSEERKNYEDLKGMFDPDRISLGDIPKEILNKFQDRTGDIGRVVFILPNFEMTQADRFMRFVEEIREVKCPECTGPFYASGESTVYYEIVKQLFDEGKYVIGFAAGCVFLALLISFRSWKHTLIVFTPLSVGLVSTIGWMAFLGIPFNIINMAALPIILGSVDDYAVLFYQRYLDQPHRSLNASYRLSVAPVIGSAMTSLIGFGSLLIGDMGGIRSFGLLCALGICLSALTTLIWFPSFLSFLKSSIPNISASRKRIFFSLLLPLLILCAPLHAGDAYSTINVPVEDPVYRDLDKLIAAKLVQTAIYGHRPWSRREVARMIAEALKNRSKSGDASPRPGIDNILDHVRKDFQEELISLGAMDGSIRSSEVHLLDRIRFDFTALDSPYRTVSLQNGIGSIDAAVNPLVANQEGRHFADGNTLGLETVHWVRYTDWFSFYARPRFQLVVPNNGPSEGSPSFQQLYAKLAYRNVEVQAGRDSLIWGQGEHGGSLFSNNARPLDMLKIDNTSPFYHPWILKYLGPSKYTLFIANLGPEREFPYTYLYGVRLSIKPVYFLELGVHHAIFIGGRGAPSISWRDPISEFFFIRRGGVRGQGSQTADHRMGIDWRLHTPFLNGLEWYFEAVWDDLGRATVIANLTEQMGFVSGLYFPLLLGDDNTDLRFEFAHFPPILYRHGTWTSGHTLNRLLLGDHLGPDSNRINLKLRHDINERFQLRFELQFASLNNGAYGQTVSANGAPDRIVKLTDEPNESRLLGCGTLSWKPKKWLSSDFFLGYEHVSNFQFIPNASVENFLGGFVLNFHLARAAKR